MKKKGSEKKRHVVAWINKAEWDQVMDQLYSKDPSLQKFALSRVSAWKARYASSTPVAVDCTADLVRCQVLDRAGALNGDDLVLMYGAALVRFVNLITERQQGKVARPLRRLAGNLNIPEWVVNLRHDFTHRKMPTLKWCRKGCKVVLEWLQQEYWSRQLGGGTSENWDLKDEEEDEEEMKMREDELAARKREMQAYQKARGLLVSYEKTQFESLGGGPEGGPFADLNWLLAEIKQFSLEASGLLIDVMLEDGFLVPTAQQLQTLGCGSGSGDGPCPVEPKLPQIFLHFWLSLLKMLNAPSFIHLLLEKLFAELKLLTAEPNDHRIFYVSAWISQLISCNAKNVAQHFETKVQRKARLKGRIFVNRIQMRWQQLVALCLEAACASTPHLLRLILDDMEHPLPLETRQKLLQLCSIYTQADRSGPAAPAQQVYTLESLREKMQRSRWRAAVARRDPVSRETAGAPGDEADRLLGSPWQVCTDDVAWKNFPLGEVPRQSSEPSSLMVESFSSMTVFDQLVEVEGAARSAAPQPPARTTQALLWTSGDVVRLKCGLRLF
ncbi:ribosomal biogenesis protein LAS1L [Takifugu rubripes]|uniref:LAS1 like ribosome biogenesis factor n=1 Tax=Takifugu rubripes TaxID=31033 RepID=A0A674P0R3_TAKRU|nr:ribosomal biogenesis protein LAS1L [Takifugu rubripes]XP_029684400.1 ribosomal biogenesis protein LAS1L [Takifugu rubripes]